MNPILQVQLGPQGLIRASVRGSATAVYIAADGAWVNVWQRPDGTSYYVRALKNGDDFPVIQMRLDPPPPPPPGAAALPLPKAA